MELIIQDMKKFQLPGDLHVDRVGRPSAVDPLDGAVQRGAGGVRPAEVQEDVGLKSSISCDVQ